MKGITPKSFDSWRKDYLKRGAIAAATATVCTLFLPLRMPFFICAVVVTAALLASPIRRKSDIQNSLIYTSAIAIILFFNLISIYSSQSNRYIYRSDSIVSCITTKEHKNTLGRFILIPTCGIYDFRLQTFGSMFWIPKSTAILEVKPYADGYIAYSPIELSMSQLDSSGPNSRWRMMPLTGPFKQFAYSEWTDAEKFASRLWVSSGYGTTYIDTDLNGSRPGLFGIRLNRPPELEDWRTIAENDALARGWHKLSSSELLHFLNADFQQNGGDEKLIRYLAIKLMIVWGQYPDAFRPENSTNVMALAKIGALRSVSDSLRGKTLTEELAASPWLELLKIQISRYIIFMDHEIQPVYENVGDGAVLSSAKSLIAEFERIKRDDINLTADSGENDEEYDDAFSKLFSGQQVDSPSEAFAAIGRLIEASAAERQNEIWSDGRVADRLKAQAICRSDQGFEDQAATRWLNEQQSERAKRAYLVVECAFEPVLERLRQAASNPGSAISMFQSDGLDNLASSLRSSESLATYALAQIEDDLAVSFLRERIDGEVQFQREMIESMRRWTTECIADLQQGPNARCILMLSNPNGRASINDSLAGTLGSRDGRMEHFLRLGFGWSDPYSEDEFVYILAMGTAMTDERMTGEQKARFCERADSDFLKLVNEGAAADRAVLLNLQRIALRLCRSEMAARADQYLGPLVAQRMPFRVSEIANANVGS